jgi:hypothetical protein
MLCGPVNYTGKQLRLFTTSLSSGQVFSIQHFSVDNDFDEVYRQFFLQSTEHWDISGLLEKFKESFQYMAGSHTSQAFIVSIDQDDLFEIEVHEAMIHKSLLPGYSPKAGEFTIQISAGHWMKASNALYVESIQQSASYFFRFPEVHRLVIGSNRLPLAVVQNILQPAGFHSWHGSPSLYACQRT